ATPHHLRSFPTRRSSDLLHQRGHPVRDELVERLDVVREAADDHARAVAFVEPERKPLQMAEELVPEVGEDALADPARQVGLHIRSEEHTSELQSLAYLVC